MREKITSALFIVLAHLVLTVHAFVPHHHHDNNLCFDLTATEVHVDHVNCEHQPKNHQPNTDNGSEQQCYLQNIVALSSGAIKQNFKLNLNTNHLFNDFSIDSLIHQKNGLIANPYCFLQISSQNHNPKYLLLACKTFGLRAPPHVS